MLRNYATSAAIAIDRAAWRNYPGRLGRLASAWLERNRSRHALAQLDERLLRDIGITSAQAIEETAMPFWKPITRR